MVPLKSIAGLPENSENSLAFPISFASSISIAKNEKKKLKKKITTEKLLEEATERAKMNRDLKKNAVCIINHLDLY